ncbi:NAD(P)H-dependent oxidoreductase [Nibricoccus sp. IMCC34717]|uniref:NAD(P)H-dependent oxidoreductase n=1 Tax=Nibricoccus sp. IMCC34717 TaxID=3034021 RepID=UPI00384D9BA3
MATLSAEKLLEVTNWRYATKKFDPARKIDNATWATLEQALIDAPSSFGLQPWKFLVITDAAVRAKLVGASWNQSQPSDCSHHVVFTLKKGIDAAHVDQFLRRQVEVRGGSLESLAGYGKIIKDSLAGAAARGDLDGWQGNQVYIALGHFMLAAALLGIDTCPMEGIERAKYDEILGLSGTRYTTLVACAAGYRAADDKYAAAKKVRFPASEVVQHI